MSPWNSYLLYIISELFILFYIISYLEDMVKSLCRGAVFNIKVRCAKYFWVPRLYHKWPQCGKSFVIFIYYFSYLNCHYIKWTGLRVTMYQSDVFQFQCVGTQINTDPPILQCQYQCSISDNHLSDHLRSNTRLDVNIASLTLSFKM